ncbi:MAG: hypothetical protein J7621_13015 [Niastella sp.]|nr:hypothetical protein [Niastella sp.]
MKYILTVILPCLLLMQTGYGQVSTDRNYVHKSDIKKPGITSQTMVDALTSPADRMQQVSYFDGLGRPVQSVAIKGSQGTKDIVSPVEYDNYGREIKNFLPYVDDGTTYGSLRTGAVTSQAYYYNAANTASDAPKDIHPYSQSLLEFSPLNRAREAGAPGATWQPGTGHVVKMLHLLNTAADSVRIWNVTVSGTIGTYSSYASPGAYAAGTLYKTVTEDEHGKQVIEFKDQEGKVILKKIQLTASADDGTGKGHVGWLCTYYLYDDWNNLRCVIQPKGVEGIIANWVLTNSTILGELCFRYEYDTRSRMIMKKVPGGGDVWMVYDNRDRLVLSQDRAMRLGYKGWMYTQYDHLNRPVSTGFIPDIIYNENLAYHVNAAANSNNYPDLDNYTEDEYTRTFYDNYDWLGSYTTGLNANYNTAYDTYLLSPSASWPYPQANVKSTVVSGLATGTRVRVVGNVVSYLYTVNIYDDIGRVIQTKATNITTGEDVITTQYTWSGQPLVVVQKQQKAGVNPQTHTIVTKMTYDDLGRLLTTSKSVNSTIGSKTISKPEQVIASHEYDALGQLKTKTLSPTGGPGGAPLETLTYDYNIRGWMLGANRTYAKDTNSTANHFGFELAYDKNDLSVNGVSDPYAGMLFNGNIAGMLWKSAGDSRVRRYDYSYDAANRLTNGYFKQFTGSSFNLNAGMDFSATGLSYDANGNILRMNQKGWKPGGSVVIDSLFYNYYASSNKLLNVIDSVNDPTTKLGDFRASQLYTQNLPGGKKSSSTVDYTYESNGNLSTDRNKDMENGILYNQLQLVRYVSVKGPGGVEKGGITYTYDALGNKLSKLVQETGQPNKTTLYLGGAVYEKDTLQFIGHEEGRLRYVKRYFTNGDSAYQYQYDYFLKDHRGNVRMVLTEQTDTTQYLASMETAYRTKEEQLFYNIPLTATTKSSIAGYPTDPNPVTVPNDLVAKVNGSGNKVGPAIVLKVMSGDKVNIGVKSFYKSGGTAGVYNDPVADIITLLASGIVGMAGESKGSLTDLNGGSSPLIGALNSFRSGNNPNQPTKPKAYLNWILLDEQLKYIAAGSGAQPLQSPDAIYALATPGELTMPKNGFLYIYVSNETQSWDVFFDNLSIQHKTGPIVEDTHYYPFGLTMASISSKAVGRLDNSYKYNGIEQNKDLDLNTYDAFYRNLDPQIGRWWQIDPKIEDMEMWSPYISNYDNPLLYSDPKGDFPILIPLIAYAIAVGEAAVTTGLVVTTVAVAANAAEKHHRANEGSGPSSYMSGSPLGLTTGDAYQKLHAKPQAAQETSESTGTFTLYKPKDVVLAKGGAESNKKGKEWEEQNGVTSRKNKETYVGESGKNRRVDDSNEKEVKEMKKNESYVQHLSGQIKDGIEYAIRTGRDYVLKLARPDKITKPLKEKAEKSGGRFRIE